MASVVYDAIFGASTLRQVSQSNLSSNMSIMDGRFSGDTYIAEQFIDSVDPTIDLTSSDVYGGLTIFRDSSHESIRIADGTSVLVPWHGRASGGTFQSGSNHVRVKGTSSTSPVQLVPVSVTAGTKGAASFQGQVHFLSKDGLEMPHSVQTGQALSSQAFQACYRLGPVSVNGTALAEQIGFTVNFGIGLSEKQHYAGAPMPVDVYIETATPTIEISTQAFAYLSTLIGGVDISSFSAFLRKCKSGSTVELDAETEHIEFSFSGGLAIHQSTSASDTKHGQNSIRIAGKQLTVTTGVAIA